MIDVGAGLSGLLPWAQLAASVGLLGLCVRFYLGRRKLQIEQQSADFTVEKHRDGLTLQLLETARGEIAALRHEVNRLQPNEEHIRHFETALDHLEALLLAESASERKLAERAAKAFLNRMRRLQEAKGIIRNEAQIIDSAIALKSREIEDKGEAD